MSKIQKVMIIDDDPSICMLLEMSLSKVGGWEVYTCDSGEQALSLANKVTPDVVLLDANMGGIDGPETLLELRKLQHYSATPFVFVTAESRAQEIERLKSFGAIGVIIKPFDPMTLPDQIVNLIKAY